MSLLLHFWVVGGFFLFLGVGGGVLLWACPDQLCGRLNMHLFFDLSSLILEYMNIATCSDTSQPQIISDTLIHFFTFKNLHRYVLKAYSSFWIEMFNHCFMGEFFTFICNTKHAWQRDKHLEEYMHMHLNYFIV